MIQLTIALDGGQDSPHTQTGSSTVTTKRSKRRQESETLPGYHETLVRVLFKLSGQRLCERSGLSFGMNIMVMYMMITGEKSPIPGRIIKLNVQRALPCPEIGVKWS